MSREEYLRLIKQALIEVRVDAEIIDEVIGDYEEHFRMGIKNGKTEEEICTELGSVEEIVAEISAMGSSTKEAKEVNKDKKEELTEADSSSKAPFTNVQVEGICADVVVKSGDVFKVDYVNNGSEKDKLAYQFYHYQEGNTFFVGVKENFRKMLFRVFYNTDIRLIVQVPTHVESIHVKLASGDCKVEGVKLQNLDMYSASGDIKIENSNVDTLYAKSSSGDVEVTNTDSKLLKCNSSSGDIEINGGNCDKIEAQSASGDVKSHALAKEYFLKSISGDVSVRMLEDAEAKYESISGDIIIQLNNNQNGYVLNASTVSGDVNIAYMGMCQSDCKSGHYTFGNQGSKIHAKTISGDIELKG